MAPMRHVLTRWRPVVSEARTRPHPGQAKHRRVWPTVTNPSQGFADRTLGPHPEWKSYNFGRINRVGEVADLERGQHLVPPARETLYKTLAREPPDVSEGLTAWSWPDE